MENISCYNYCVEKGVSGIPCLKVRNVGFEKHGNTTINIINYKEIESFIEKYGSQKDLNNYYMVRSYVASEKECRIKMRVSLHGEEICAGDYLVVENRENKESKIWLYSKDWFEKKYRVVK